MPLLVQLCTRCTPPAVVSNPSARATAAAPPRDSISAASGCFCLSMRTLHAMFKQQSTCRVTTACLVNSELAMAQDDSFTRLMDAAKSIQSELASPSEVGRRLNESPQTMTNWATRGVSSLGALNAQRIIGVSATWILYGDEPQHWRQSQTARLTPETIAAGWELAQLVSAQTTGTRDVSMPRDADLITQSINTVLERDQGRNAASQRIDIGEVGDGVGTGKAGTGGKPSGAKTAGKESGIQGGGRKQSAA